MFMLTQMVKLMCSQLVYSQLYVVVYPWNFNGSDKPILANVAYKYNDDFSTMSQFRGRDQSTMYFQNMVIQVADPVDDTIYLDNAYSTTPFMLRWNFKPLLRQV